MEDGATALQQLFGLNSHLLGCDDNAEVLLVNPVCQKLPAGQALAMFSMLKTSYLSLPIVFPKVSGNANV